MNRINLFVYPPEDDFDSTPVHDGWFDLDKAEMFPQDTEWNGRNHISVHTGSQWDSQTLYRTSGGKWVLNHSSARQGTLPRYERIGDEQAMRWLIVNNSDDVVTRFFGPLPEESGPAPTGRPKEFGDPFPQRLTPAVQDVVDQLARDAGVPRAEMVRRLVDAGLASGAPKEYVIPGAPAGLVAVTDAFGIEWTRGPGRGDIWQPPADLDLSPAGWKWLMFERGPLHSGKTTC